MTDRGGLPDDPRIEQAVEAVTYAIIGAIREQIAERDRAEARVAELEAALAKAQARAMPEWAEMLTRQSCPKGVHSDWFVDSEHSHLCPWCGIAELDATIKRVRELCAMVGGTAVYVRDVLAALDATGDWPLSGGSGEDGP